MAGATQRIGQLLRHCQRQWLQLCFIHQGNLSEMQCSIFVSVPTDRIFGSEEFLHKVEHIGKHTIN